MDDTTKVPSTNYQIPNDQNVTQQPVPPQVVVPTATSGSKEAMPIPAGQATSEFATEQAPVLDKEVAEVGVETRGETLIVPEEAAIGGLEPAKEAVPVPANPTKIAWPITPQKAQEILKAPHLAFKQSVVWLATVITKVLKKQKTAVQV